MIDPRLVPYQPKTAGPLRARVDTVPGERPVHFDADLQLDLPVLAVPVDRDVPTRPRNLLCPDDAPHRSAGFGDDLGEIRGSRATANDREGPASELFESNLVFHPRALLPPDA